ncbi:hypothetical protein BX616_009940, partial [Lobosporangium transversale]
TWKEGLLRQVMMNYIPPWVHGWTDAKECISSPNRMASTHPNTRLCTQLPQECKRKDDNEAIVAA